MDFEVASTATGVNATYRRQILPKSYQVDCVVEKFRLRGRLCNQSKPDLSHLETPRLPLLSDVHERSRAVAITH
jgi:hypothetical protein